MTKSDLTGESLTLLLMGKTTTGDDDWAVFPGSLVIEHDTVFLDRGARVPRFEIRDEWLTRIRLVATEEATLFKTKYVLPLTAGIVDDDDDGVPTGLKWPD